MEAMQADIEDITGRSASNAMKAEARTADRLRSIVERVERLEEEKRLLANDIKDIYAEAKSAGFLPKVIRALIRERAQEPAEMEEMATLLDVYRRAMDS